MSVDAESDAVDDARLAPRASVRAHMRHLMAAAAALGVANAAACTQKDNAAPDAAPTDAGEPKDAADAALVTDASGTAESTLDATIFAGPDAARARAEAGAAKKQPGHGYRVVDPLPPPTRIRRRPECDPPYVIDDKGFKKYKVDCLDE